MLILGIGVTSPDCHRGLAGHQSIRDDAHAASDLQNRGRKRCLGCFDEVLVRSSSQDSSNCAANRFIRYKGMAASASTRAPPGRSSTLTPQSTGFSQMGGRPGGANESSGAAMSVLLSWHEKVVEVAGLGCVGRTMTDWRKV